MLAHEFNKKKRKESERGAKIKEDYWLQRSLRENNFKKLSGQWFQMLYIGQIRIGFEQFNVYLIKEKALVLFKYCKKPDSQMSRVSWKWEADHTVEKMAETEGDHVVRKFHSQVICCHLLFSF